MSRIFLQTFHSACTCVSSQISLTCYGVFHVLMNYWDLPCLQHSQRGTGGFSHHPCTSSIPSREAARRAAVFITAERLRAGSPGSGTGTRRGCGQRAPWGAARGSRLCAGPGAPPCSHSPPPFPSKTFLLQPSLRVPLPLAIRAWCPPSTPGSSSGLGPVPPLSRLPPRQAPPDRVGPARLGSAGRYSRCCCGRTSAPWLGCAPHPR